MSKAIKPKQGVVYECYKGFTDRFGDRVRVGQKFTYDGDDMMAEENNYYVFQKASGRGIDIAVPLNKFTAHFCPAAEQTEQPTTKPKFKVGDTVLISDDSEYYDLTISNPANVKGVITKIMDESLGIVVKWNNDTENSYNERDLILVEAKQGLYLDVNEKLKHMNLTAIAVNSVEQIKELAKVSFLKDQIEAAFPELFVTHKVGNRYKHSDGNRYILTGENSHIALTNLKTGMIESYTVHVEDYDKITSDEFNKLCLDYKELTLIKERQ